MSPARQKAPRGQTGKTKKSPGRQPPTGGQPAGDGLLTMEAAISLLATTRPTFYRWLRSGRLKGLKLGGRWRFEPAEIERLRGGEEPRINPRADPAPLIARLEQELARLDVTGAMAKDKGCHHGVEGVCRLLALVAIALNASDLHLAVCKLPDAVQPQGILRYRVDGRLFELGTVDPRLIPPIVEQWKVWIACDRHETGRPQDGRMLLELAGERVDARIAILPTVFGESLVVRFLRKKGDGLISLDDCGLKPQVRALVDKWLKASWGMIVCVGPTGSGKTSTLYACVSAIAGPETQTIAIEDPVELQLPWVSHVQINTEKGLTFPAAIRSALRSDPDILMIGEVRERDSWALAEMAAKTGHLVFTTMHVADAVTATLQMKALGGEAFRRGSAVRLVLAQRLIRKLCGNCRKQEPPPAHLLAEAGRLLHRHGLDAGAIATRFWTGTGCPRCGHLGFSGRVAVVEALEITPAYAAALAADSPETELRSVAERQGMIPLLEAGLDLALAGVTSLSEVFATFATPG